MHIVFVHGAGVTVFGMNHGPEPIPVVALAVLRVL
jgi:hypothetical protein